METSDKMGRKDIILGGKYWIINIHGQVVRKKATGFYSAGVLFGGLKRTYSDVYLTKEEAEAKKKTFDIRNYQGGSLPPNIKTD